MTIRSQLSATRRSIHHRRSRQCRRSRRLGAQAASSAAPPGNSSDGAHGRARPPRKAFAAPRQATGVRADDSSLQPVHVHHRCIDGVINLKGGELDQADLSNIRCARITPNIPVRLLSRSLRPSLYLLQTGLIGGGGEAAADASRGMECAGKTFALPAGAKELRVPLTWTDGQGLTVTRPSFSRAACIPST